MLVDDSPLSRTLIAGILSAKGHEVSTFQDGQEALAQFANIRPDAVLLDFEMPGLSGLETCIELRKRPDSYNVPIAIVSSHEAEEEISTALTNGADEYILKPIRANELASKISFLMAKRAAPLGAKMAGNVIFSGRYHIIKLLGKGGYSMVYLARDLRTNKEVAIKIMESSSLDDNSTPQFLREAYGLSMLDHPNIVKYMESSHFSDKRFLVTEYIRGESLSAFVKKAPFSELDLIQIADKMCSALSHMSARNVIHRDIKADNILISKEGRVVLIDFGLARGPQQDTLSLGNDFHGTPQYVAPEYIRNEELSVKSDIYSLGITLFYAASGKFPFPSPDASAIIHSHLTVIPPRLEKNVPGISKIFSIMIEKMLVKPQVSRCSLSELREIIDALKSRPAFEQHKFLSGRT
ncbi:MAG: hypothetical protein A2X49_02430 [Lentisphaerae bacterium GWF2_52_8]|nr:MAG: hypothetical protein A2X49_02430 [Lentisphaerae bacterium GWF2_52_8]